MIEDYADNKRPLTWTNGDEHVNCSAELKSFVERLMEAGLIIIYMYSVFRYT